jgi:hypothetical protein
MAERKQVPTSFLAEPAARGRRLPYPSRPLGLPKFTPWYENGTSSLLRCPKRHRGEKAWTDVARGAQFRGARCLCGECETQPGVGVRFLRKRLGSPLSLAGCHSCRHGAFFGAGEVSVTSMPGRCNIGVGRARSLQPRLIFACQSPFVRRGRLLRASPMIR